MEIEYFPNPDVQEAEIAANAIGMIIVGSAMVLAGISILDILLSKRRTY